MRRFTRSVSVFRSAVEGVAESEITQNIVCNVKELAANPDVHLPPPSVNRVKKSKKTKVKVSRKDKVTTTHDAIDCLTPNNLVLTTCGNQAVNTTVTSPGPSDAIRTRDGGDDEDERDIKKDIISYSYSSLAAPKSRPANSNSDGRNGGGSRNESTTTQRKKSLRSYSVTPTCHGRGEQQEFADNFYKLDLLTETGPSPSPRTSISNITDAVNSGEDGFSASPSKPTSTPTTVSSTGVSRQKHSASTTKPKLPKKSDLPTDSDQQEIVRTVEAVSIDPANIGPGTSNATRRRRHARANKHKLPKSSALPTDSDQQEIVHSSVEVEVDLSDLTKADPSTSGAARPRSRTKKSRLPKNYDLPTNSNRQEIVPNVESDLIDITKVDPSSSDAARPRASKKKLRLPKNSALPTASVKQDIVHSVEVDLIDLTEAVPCTSDAARPRVRTQKTRLPKNSDLRSDSDQQGIEIVRTVEVGCIDLGKIGPSTSDAAEDGDARTDIKEVSSPSISSISSTLKLRSRKAPGRSRRNEATGKASLTSSDSAQNISNYTLSCSAEEDHRKQIYGVAFNWFLKPDQPLIFATVGSNRISIYECVKAAPPLLDPKSRPDLNQNQQRSKDDSPLKLLQVYEDFDDDEVFYTCAWTIDAYVGSYLAAAGLRGVIRIFSPADGECVKDFVGHTGAVNSLSVHPLDFNLLLSSSQDHSIRLWNIKTNVCVAIFSGESGHRDGVIDAGFSLSGNRFASGGLDHSVKVWLLDRDDIKFAIRNSYTWQAQIVKRGRVKACKPFPTFLQHFPDFTSRDIHHDYVDCVKWFGEFLISKSSVANKIVCWKGGDMFQKWAHVIDQKIKKHTVVHEWKVEKCEHWFLRFGFDGKQKKLALGNEVGEIYVFEMTGRESEDGPSKIKPEVLRHLGCTSIIRQTAWSRDGKVLICVCDDSTVWRWDYSEK